MPGVLKKERGRVTPAPVGHASLNSYPWKVSESSLSWPRALRRCRWDQQVDATPGVDPERDDTTGVGVSP